MNAKTQHGFMKAGSGLVNELDTDSNSILLPIHVGLTANKRNENENSINNIDGRSGFADIYQSAGCQ